jgi:hypothetical protein
MATREQVFNTLKSTTKWLSSYEIAEMIDASPRYVGSVIGQAIRYGKPIDRQVDAVGYYFYRWRRVETTTTVQAAAEHRPLVIVTERAKHIDRLLSVLPDLPNDAAAHVRTAILSLVDTVPQ